MQKIGDLVILSPSDPNAFLECEQLGGVFETVRTKFRSTGASDLLSKVTRINDFRNTFVAHQEKELTDPKKAEYELKHWIAGLRAMTEA